MTSATNEPPLNLLERFSYGVGPMSEGLLTGSVSVFLFFYYNQVLGLSGSLAGTALLVSMVFDAFTDPLVGSVSDRTQSRLGRRHPFIFVSAIPMGVCVMLLFAPPGGMGQWGLFAWLTLFTVLARLALTLFYVPHMSLGAELSSDYHERNNIVALRRFFSLTGTMLVTLVGLGYFFADSPAHPNGQLNAAAYLPFGLLIGSLMIVAVLASAFGTLSRIPYLSSLSTRPPLSVRQFITEYSSVLSNKNFRSLLLGLLGFYAIVGVYTTLSLHTSIHFWKLGSQQIFILFIAGAVGSVSGIPVWVFVTRFFTDKKAVFMVGLLWWLALVALPPSLALAGLLSPGTNSHHFMALVFCGYLAMFGAAATSVVGGSMVADCVDDHDLRSGQRQEGNFFGAFAFGEKALTGIGAWLGGMLLDIIEFPANAVPGSVDPAVVTQLGIVGGPGLVIGGMLSFFFLTGYSISRAQHQQTLARLSARGQTV